MKTSEIEVCLSTRMTAPLANNRSARKSRWVAFFMSLRGIHEVDGPFALSFPYLSGTILTDSFFVHNVRQLNPQYFA